MLQVAQWTTAQWIANAALLAVVLTGAYTDLRWRRLPNWLTLGAVLIALGLHFATRGLAGAWESVLGWLLGCALLFMPFALGGMGAGDVKLLGAVGALRGASFVFVSFVYLALIGGALALALLARRGALLPLLGAVLGGLWFALRSLIVYRALPPLASLGPLPTASEAGMIGQPNDKSRAIALPYGVVIAAGVLLALALGY